MEFFFHKHRDRWQQKNITMASVVPGAMLSEMVGYFISQCFTPLLAFFSWFPNILFVFLGSKMAPEAACGFVFLGSSNNSWLCRNIADPGRPDPGRPRPTQANPGRPRPTLDLRKPLTLGACSRHFVPHRRHKTRGYLRRFVPFWHHKASVGSSP